MERIFEKKFALVIILLCLPLVFLPKINLVAFDEETAGLRIDDFVLAILSALLGWAFFLKNKRLVSIECWLLAIVFFSLISFLINQILYLTHQINVSAKIFYVVRILEYFLFFYIGCMASQFISESKIIALFLFINIPFMLLQKFGVVGTMRGIGRIFYDQERVSGLASHPAEMGALLSMAYAYMLFGKASITSLLRIKLPPLIGKLMSELQNIFLMLLFLILTILTGARIAIGAICVLFLCYQFNVKRLSLKKLFLLLILGGVILLPSIYWMMQSKSLFSRSSGILSFNNFNIIATAWDNVRIDIDLNDNIHLTPGDYDMSWWMRIHKWCYALKMYATHSMCWLQGVGPGTCTAALDGSFLRILVENGLIGCVIYWKFFQCIYTQSRQLKGVFFAFLLNMIFFDIYLAYKPMSFLLLLTGFAYPSKALEKLSASKGSRSSNDSPIPMNLTGIPS